MNDEQLEVARELAGHLRFEWRPGMVAVEGPASYGYDYRWRITSGAPDLAAVTSEGDVHEAPTMPAAFERAIPDITDDATGGVLWAMVGKPLVVGVGESGFISIQDPTMPTVDNATVTFGGGTLAEACARLLLAKWGE
jgi:hypothetical protein